MATLEIRLNGEDMDRLFLCKSMEGYDGLTAQEYAEKLLIQELHRLFPHAPQWDEDGQLVRSWED